MRTATDEPSSDAPATQSAARRHPRRRRRVVITLVVLLAGAVVVIDRIHPDGISLLHPLSIRHPPTSGSADNGAATSTATIARRSLSETTSVSGTLAYAGEYTVLGQGHGTVTALPAVGQVIRQGQVLYRVNGGPVVLLYGATPFYRNLAEGTSASDVTGADVQELNHDLVALGYASSSDLEPSSDEFSRATKAGIENLQTHLGITPTGKLAWGQVVFEPTALRVTTVSATLGGPVGGPVLTATSTSRQVTVALDAPQQSQVKVGDKVSITLPNDKTTPGRVTSVGTVATIPAGSRSGSGSSSTPTVTVHITPTNASATGSLDQAPVQVAITTDTVRNALVVPVNALLALAGGGYAVEVVDAGETHHLAPVTLGLFDDSAGLVQVTGSGISAGQRVVVPAS